MSWIKEANKKGKYHKTKYGFRIYEVVEPSYTSQLVERNDGVWRRTDFHKGFYFATDKNGISFTGDYWNVISKIETETMVRFYSKQK